MQYELRIKQTNSNNPDGYVTIALFKEFLDRTLVEGQIVKPSLLTDWIGARGEYYDGSVGRGLLVTVVPGKRGEEVTIVPHGEPSRDFWIWNHNLSARGAIGEGSTLNCTFAEAPESPLIFTVVSLGEGQP
jgi:hypothetical protein